MSTFGKCEGGGRRSATRSTVPLVGLLTTMEGTRSAVIVDVSPTGARLRGKDLPHKWSDFFISIDGVVTFGTVQWEDGDERGIAFDARLDPTEEQILREKIHAAGTMPPELRAAFDDWTSGFAQ
jgi:PilZ domain